MVEIKIKQKYEDIRVTLVLSVRILNLEAIM